MSKLVPIALAPVSAPTATGNGTGVDVSDYTGNGKLILDASQPASGQTLDVKLQHSDTLGGTYTDTGHAFTQVTNAGGASYQVLDISVDGFKKFVRVARTIAGSATAPPCGVYLVANKAL